MEQTNGQNFQRDGEELQQNENVAQGTRNDEEGTRETDKDEAGAPLQKDETGAIRNVAVLDFTGMKSPDDLSGISSISNVATILVPEPLNKALMNIRMENVASVVPIPEGKNVKVLSGQLKMSGESLANERGTDDDVLVIAGQTIITTVVEKVGYKHLIVSGQVLAPKGSETALGAGISRLSGQVIYYGSNPRIFMGDEQFSKPFFELLDEPVSLVLFGNYTIDADVPAELLKQKVSEIILFGNMNASSKLVPLLQVLATEKYGNISALPCE